MAVEYLSNFDAWLKALNHLNEATARLEEARRNQAPDFEAAKHDWLNARKAIEEIDVG